MRRVPPRLKVIPKNLKGTFALLILLGLSIVVNIRLSHRTLSNTSTIIVVQDEKPTLIWLETENQIGTSPHYWETIRRHVVHEDAQNNAFCLPWSVDSDLWWTHHPDWEIYEETENHYCFRLVPDVSKRKYLQDVYQFQFQTGNCSNVFTTQMWSSGWNADMKNLIDTLRYARTQGRPMQVRNGPWHYAAPDHAGKENSVPSTPACPRLNMFCYFLNVSKCEPAAEQDKDYNYERDPPWANEENTWLRDYFARPQTWLRRRVYEFVRSKTLAKPCTVMHVRRSDVILHGQHSRKYHSIAEYLNAASPNHVIHPNILLLTDDQNAIEEATTLHPNFSWMYISRPRFRADEGGWERHLPSSNPIFEMTVLLGTFELVKQCQSIVHTTSGFVSWLILSMEKSASNVSVFNLDSNRHGILDSNNGVTKSISVSYPMPH